MEIFIWQSVRVVLVLAICYGLFRWVSKRRQTKMQDLGSVSRFSQPTGTDSTEHIAALHREATKYKDSGEWDKAISCLREAEKLGHSASTVFPVKHYLRLPLFLQQGGYFDAAMEEFQKLIDDTENRVLRGLPKRNISAKQQFIHADLSEIYNSMKTACKREKKNDLAETYKALSDKHREIFTKLRDAN